MLDATPPIINSIGTNFNDKACRVANPNKATIIIVGMSTHRCVNGFLLARINSIPHEIPTAETIPMGYT